jgi:O-antigen/teichoic acid export membrane protein
VTGRSTPELDPAAPPAAPETGAGGGPANGGGSIAARAASSALLLLTRRVLIMGVSAVSTVFVARRIGVGGFGTFASAQALSALLGGIADFGFSIVLSREMARNPSGRGGIMGVSLRVATVSGILSALILVVIGLASGPTSRYAVVLYILAPTLVMTGVSTFRQIYLVVYRVRDLAYIDIGTNLAQSALIIAVALAGLGLYGVVIVTSVTGVLNSLLVGYFGKRLVRSERPSTAAITAFLKAAFPIGLASFFSSIYFTIDLVLLAWLVSKPEVGQYAAALKFLNLLVQIPSFVVVAVMPGLSSLHADRAGRSELVARIWHWLVSFGLPTCLTAGVFAAPLIHLAFGSRYDPAIGMFRILSAAAAASLISNVLGVLLNSLAIGRWQVVQNSIAIVFNVVGNLLLAPRYGPLASAWLTLATELIVDTGAVLALRGRVDFHPAMAVTVRPLIACALLAAVGLALEAEPAIAAPAAVLTYVVALIGMRAWPREFVIPVRFRRS